MPPDSACLNCGAELRGPFCSRCGQRAVAPYPTIKELIGDAWQEVSGWDGRFARTLRTLLRRPGLLTVDVLEGRRARYVSPVRLYLVASVTYFLVAAIAPNVRVPRAPELPGSDRVTIDILEAEGGRPAMSDEERAAVEKSLARAPWWAQAVLRPVLNDPAKFRRDFLDTLPRVLFVLVPVFAGIVALFYRRRFSQHLVFALHLHAAIFITLALLRIAAFTRNTVLVLTLDVAGLIGVVAYALAAFRRVYVEGWLPVVMKSVGIAALYFVAGVTGLIAALAVAALAG